MTHAPKGFSAVGLVSPKSPENIGAVLRAAHCYRAAMVAIQGERTNVRSILDTPKAWRQMPVLRGADLRDYIPFDAVPVAVDLVDDAVELPDFVHPQRAFYIFGPEDGTLGKKTIEWCKHKVMIPTRDCMNLAATVNVVLYDRLAKQARASKLKGVGFTNDTARELSSEYGDELPQSILQAISATTNG